jgi:hypothetical protein
MGPLIRIGIGLQRREFVTPTSRSTRRPVLAVSLLQTRFVAGSRHRLRRPLDGISPPDRSRGERKPYGAVAQERWGGKEAGAHRRSQGKRLVGQAWAKAVCATAVRSVGSTIGL